MFTRAVAAAMQFTKHILTLTAFEDGHAECKVGALTHVNSDGWVITADHIVADFLEALKGAESWAVYNQECQSVRASTTLDENGKGRALRRIKKPGPKTPQVVSLASEGALIAYSGLERFTDIDVAVFRLSNFDPARVSRYPAFYSGGSTQTGVSLCKLGFPLPEVKLSYFPDQRRFDLGPGTQLPYFPLDGMLTRHIMVADPLPHRINYERVMLEVSTGGLRGQSGGPLFDQAGRIWGIQSRIMTFPMGFDVEIKDARGKVASKMPQVFHVGWAASVQAIVPILRELQIAFDADDTSP